MHYRRFSTMFAECFEAGCFRAGWSPGNGTPASLFTSVIYHFPSIYLNSSADQDLVAAAGWTPTNELFSCSDDRTIYKWDMTGDAVGKVRAPSHQQSLAASFYVASRIQLRDKTPGALHRCAILRHILPISIGTRSGTSRLQLEPTYSSFLAPMVRRKRCIFTFPPYHHFNH